MQAFLSHTLLESNEETADVPAASDWTMLLIFEKISSLTQKVKKTNILLRASTYSENIKHVINVWFYALTYCLQSASL